MSMSKDAAWRSVEFISLERNVCRAFTLTIMLQHTEIFARQAPDRHSRTIRSGQTVGGVFFRRQARPISIKIE